MSASMSLIASSPCQLTAGLVQRHAVGLRGAAATFLRELRLVRHRPAGARRAVRAGHDLGGLAGQCRCADSMVNVRYIESGKVRSHAGAEPINELEDRPLQAVVT